MPVGKPWFCHASELAADSTLVLITGQVRRSKRSSAYSSVRDRAVFVAIILLHDNVFLRVYTDRVVIERYEYLGIALSNEAFILAVVFAVAFAIGFKRKGSVPFGMTGLIIALLIVGLLRLPFSFEIPMMIIGGSLGGAIDMSRRKRNWPNSNRWIPVTFLVVVNLIGIGFGVALFNLMRKPVTLSTDRLSEPFIGQLFLLSRDHVEATILPSEPGIMSWFLGTGDMWFFRNPTNRPAKNMEFATHFSEVNFYGAEVYMDSHGHLLHGDDLAKIVAKWSNTKPRIQRN